MLRAVGSVQNTGIVSVAQSSVPSYSLTGTTTQTVLDSINIAVPHGAVMTPDSELIVSVSWSCNSSANTKQLKCLFGDIGSNSAFLPFTDSQTTNVSNEWMFRITFRGNGASAQVISANQAFTPSATSFGNTSYALTYSGVPGQPIQMSFWGTLANASDSMRIERYSVWFNQAATYPSNRLFSGQKVFWGGNAHFDDIVPGGGGITTAQVIASMKAMHMTTLRMTWEGSTASLNSLVAMAQALQADGTGLKMYCCIDLSLTSDGTNFWPNEAAAYAYGFTSGQTVVSALKPYGVTMFECGNELDTKNNMNSAGATGYYRYYFNNSQWPIMRGIVAGCTAAVQAQGCLAASPACTVCGVGALDMLWNGSNPDGTGGRMPVKWDITAFHNYQPYGPLTAVQTYTSGPYVNVYQYLNNAYGKPIVISEFNGGAGNTEAQNATWCTRVMNEAYNLRYKYNIMGMIIYQLFQGDPWGMIATPSSATPSNPLGTTVQGLMNSLTDTGT